MEIMQINVTIWLLTNKGYYGLEFLISKITV